MASEVTYVCDTCHCIVGPGEGHILVDDRKAYRIFAEQRERDYQRQQAEHEAGNPLFVAFDIATAIEEPAEWKVFHRECIGKQEYHHWYGFSVAESSTYEALLSHTLHLMGKVWIGATDWYRFVCKVAHI